MADFFTLPNKERREALTFAADASGRPIHLLEKDVWVVWSLQQVFTGPYAAHLVFKGGTSLSKAYKVIRRFSEDIDLTYDIREIAADLIRESGSLLPPNKSQEKKWTKAIRERLAEWVSNKMLPTLSTAIAQQKLSATAKADGEKILIEYEALATGTGYVKPTVTLEFGARSTGEPSELRDVACDAAEHVPSITFPSARPMVMRPERTFWEKATAIHVFCAQGEFRGGDRFARHWHDVTRLDVAGFTDKAIADRNLAKNVADHKNIFFTEKDGDGIVIDYVAAVSGGLRLVPTDGALAKLAADYQHMVEDGLLLDDVESFDALIAQCKAVQEKANTPAPPLRPH